MVSILGVSSNDFAFYLLSHLSQQALYIIIAALTLFISSITLRYSLVEWNRNNLFDKIMRISAFTTSVVLKVWAGCVILLIIAAAICWPLLITAATTSIQTINFENDSIDIQTLLRNTTSDLANGDMSSLLTLNIDEYLSQTCSGLTNQRAAIVNNCTTESTYDLFPLGFTYTSNYMSVMQGDNIVVDVADPTLQLGPSYTTTVTVAFNGSNITQTNNGWRFDVGPKKISLHPTDERNLLTSFTVNYANASQMSIISPLHRLSADMNYRLMAKSFTSNFSTTSFLNDNQNFGIFLTTVQNQRTWFDVADLSTAIQTFLNESGSLVQPIPALNFSVNNLNAVCPVLGDAYCGYAINIRQSQGENMTDIIAFFGRYLYRNMVSISTTTYYSGLANYTKGGPIIEPSYVQGSMFKYPNTSATDRHRVLYAVHKPYNIYEATSNPGSGSAADINYNFNEIESIKDKLKSFMTVQNGGIVNYQYQVITATIVFQDWFKWLSVAVIITGVVLFFASRIFTNKFYAKSILEILNIQLGGRDNREIFLETEPHPHLRLDDELVKIDEEHAKMLDKSREL